MSFPGRWSGCRTMRMQRRVRILPKRSPRPSGFPKRRQRRFANAVVDPSEVRKSIGDTTDPDVEKIPVPGGTLLGIRTSRAPRPPTPGRWRRGPPSFPSPLGRGEKVPIPPPAPEPRSLDPAQRHKAELAVDIENRHHLTWASQQAASFVLAENDWRAS